MTIPQFVPYWDEQEISAVSNVLSNSDYLNEHKTVREFERSFAEFVGAKHCVAVTSGTIALYCAINTTMSSNSDHQNDFAKQVRIPSHDGIFAFNALTAAGASPVVDDVNMHDGNLLYPPNNNGKNPQNNYNHSIAVHANGRISDFIQGIEDCSQAIGHHTKNKISTYSFASTKHITTGGQGGAICCDDQEVFDTLVRLKDHGRNDRQSLKPMSDNYDTWGMNFKLTEIQAAFGLAQLRGLQKRIDRLKQIYTIYRDLLADHNDISSFDDYNKKPPGWYVDIFTPHADKIHEKLKTKKIYCRRYPKPLHMQKVAAGHVMNNGDAHCSEPSLPNAEQRYKTGLYLPSTTNLSDENIKFVAGEIINAINEL